MSENTKVVIEQGGDVFRLDAGATLKNQSSNVATDCTLTIEAGTTNEVSATLQATNGEDTLSGLNNFFVWGSDDAAGQGITSITGALTAGAKGDLVGTTTSGKHYIVQTEAADGLAFLTWTDTGAEAFTLCAQPAMGGAVVTVAVGTADYG